MPDDNLTWETRAYDAPLPIIIETKRSANPRPRDTPVITIVFITNDCRSVSIFPYPDGRTIPQSDSWKDVLEF